MTDSDPRHARPDEDVVCILICPPVGPFSPVQEIDKWIGELRRMLVQYEGHTVQETLESHLDWALEWRSEAGKYG